MADQNWQKEESPFHSGERAIHTKLGTAKRMDVVGRRIIRDFLPKQHQIFYAQLPYVIVGSIDANGNPWASILVGEPGFMTAANDRTLHLDIQPIFGDPLSNNLAEGVDIGFLGIELQTRRRNRVNGVVSNLSPEGFDVQVGQTFGNCPQYIQARTFALEAFKPTESRPIQLLRTLGETEHAAILAADTFFIASAYLDKSAGAARGVDVSHRGGKPGFIHVDGNTLTIPDYHGNNAFNTFGNLEMNPRAGLLFIDFESGDLLYLTGRADIIWDGSPKIERYKGAERLLKCHVEQGIWVKGGIPKSWSEPEYSPFLEKLKLSS